MTQVTDSLSRYWWPVLGLTLVTFLSRLTLFMGVKHLGGMQTALLGLGELLVTLVFAHWMLGESLSRSSGSAPVCWCCAWGWWGWKSPPANARGQAVS